MLFFFAKDLDFESIEIDRLHKVARSERGMRKPVQFTDVFLQNDRPRKIKRLAQHMQNRHPAFQIRRSCKSKLLHDFRFDFLMLYGFCPDAHYFAVCANQP